MAIEKVEEKFKEEVSEQPEGVPVDVTVEGEEEVVEERPQDDYFPMVEADQYGDHALK